MLELKSATLLFVFCLFPISLFLFFLWGAWPLFFRIPSCLICTFFEHIALYTFLCGCSRYYIHDITIYWFWCLTASEVLKTYFHLGPFNPLLLEHNSFKCFFYIYWAPNRCCFNFCFNHQIWSQKLMRRIADYIYPYFYPFPCCFFFSFFLKSQAFFCYHFLSGELHFTIL